ncbi:2,4-dihydroxyhept-2-ene-1,7-dioic acid aldolase [Rhodovastum atsumiense]|uniref:Aldolase n=1 Tax=Rhodovastum atsumiense TaxID=504468 RepID=A0A5M6IPN6_9PROT|nr:aldolase/citrate lyase family protein [Rhodovastum atsumiense]KAA5610221.1 aldolase [Rhodovastum atsumiense]CAH2604163.1 2,4-dihydroxyhept-2-ene-1,7-dioic acid aldolase [Rhodovastum atsumiense]
MPLIPNAALARLRAGKMALGYGLHHMRTAAVPALARAAGYHWLFIDMEHGAFSIHEASELCLAALPAGVAPIVRICTDALDEGTRVLDNGAQGIIVPHVDTAEQARRIANAFRFPPRGNRSWGGLAAAAYGFRAPEIAVAQSEINREVLVAVMIETAQAVANVNAIAAVPGIDCLLVGTADLTADLGIPGEIGHERVAAAYRAVIEACGRHAKFAGMHAVFDETHARTYVSMGARFVLGGTDSMFLQQAAAARAEFLNDIG